MCQDVCLMCISFMDNVIDQFGDFLLSTLGCSLGLSVWGWRVVLAKVQSDSEGPCNYHESGEGDRYLDVIRSKQSLRRRRDSDSH